MFFPKKKVRVTQNFIQFHGPRSLVYMSFSLMKALLGYQSWGITKHLQFSIPCTCILTCFLFGPFLSLQTNIFKIYVRGGESKTVDFCSTTEFKVVALEARNLYCSFRQLLSVNTPPAPVFVGNSEAWLSVTNKVISVLEIRYTSRMVTEGERWEGHKIQPQRINRRLRECFFEERHSTKSSINPCIKDLKV